MNFRKVCAALLLLSAVALISCSGNPKPCTSNCGGNGNATLSMTWRATPLTPPPNTNLLSFIVDVNTITLTSSTGTNVNIPLNSTNLSVDLTKLQSDSVFLGTSTTVPAGSYTSMTVSLTNPVVTFCTQTLGNAGCAAGSITTITAGAAAAPKITAAPFPLTLTSNQQTGLALNFNLANALTVNASQVVTAVNLGAANVLSANSLPSTSTSLAAGQLDFVEDVTGVVTAVNATTQSVTVKTATRGSLTAIANSSTVFSPNCTAFSLSLTFASCVVQGHVASLDMVLNANGTFTLLEYDPLALATTSGDWIEGVVPAPPTSSTQFSLVTNDAVFATSGSIISSKLSFGASLNATLVSPKPFLVDTKGLTVPVNNFTGTDASILLPGQTLSVHVTAFTSGTTPATASVDQVYLRFTRVSGTVAATGTQASFNIQSVPSFFGVATQPSVQITAGAPPSTPATNFDGVSSAAALSNPQTVSIRALYFGQGTATPFSAAKVRVP